MSDPVPLEELCEERLDQVLGICRAVPAAAQKGIERIPVDFAQGGQRFARVRRGTLVTGGEHEAPAGRREKSALAVRPHGVSVAFDLTDATWMGQRRHR